VWEVKMFFYGDGHLFLMLGWSFRRYDLQSRRIMKFYYRGHHQFSIEEFDCALYR
jgi:hypothetical protein